MGIDQRQVADDIPGRVIQDRGIRIVGRFCRDRTASGPVGVEKALVGYNGAVNHIVVHLDVESHRCHTVGYYVGWVGIQHPGRCVLRSMNCQAVLQWRHPGRDVGYRNTVQGRAIGNISRVGRDRVR